MTRTFPAGLKLAAAALVMTFLLAACAPGTETYTSDQAGLFSGIWHGWIAPISIIWHFVFDDSVRVYETNNTGIWYDIGFYMAIISGFGSLSLTRRTNDRRGRGTNHRD